jgi:hypothetical protein
MPETGSGEVTDMPVVGVCIVWGTGILQGRQGDYV